MPPLDDLYFHLLAQFFDDFDDVPVQRLVNYFPPVLRRKYQAIFTPIAGMCHMLYLIFHLRKTSLLFRDALAKPSRLYHGGSIFPGVLLCQKATMTNIPLRLCSGILLCDSTGKLGNAS